MAATSSASGASPATTRSADFHRLQDDEGKEVTCCLTQDPEGDTSHTDHLLGGLALLDFLVLVGERLEAVGQGLGCVVGRGAQERVGQAAGVAATAIRPQSFSQAGAEPDAHRQLPRCLARHGWTNGVGGGYRLRIKDGCE